MIRKALLKDFGKGFFGLLVQDPVIAPKYMLHVLVHQATLHMSHKSTETITL